MINSKLNERFMLTFHGPTIRLIQPWTSTNEIVEEYGHIQSVNKTIRKHLGILLDSILWSVMVCEITSCKFLAWAKMSTTQLILNTSQGIQKFQKVELQSRVFNQDLTTVRGCWTILLLGWVWSGKLQGITQHHMTHSM